MAASEPPLPGPGLPVPRSVLPSPRPPGRRRGAILGAIGVLVVLAAAFLPNALLTRSQLEAVKAAGKLRVLTFNGPTTYYEGPGGPSGFEYDLAQAFASQLGVTLEMVVEPNFPELIPRLLRGDADFAAAGLTITEARSQILRFTPPYQETRQQVIYRRGNERPRGIGDLVGHSLTVLAGSSYVDELRRRKQDLPGLTWNEVDDVGIEELMIEVWWGLVELSVADSNMVSVMRQFYPELHVAFDLSAPQPLAWAFRPGDPTLLQAASEFIEGYRKSGDLARLIERHYGPALRSNFLDTVTFQRRAESVLPVYRALFVEAAEKSGLDWRLLAAMAYQESLWDPEAVSPTGVRGIMMLTEDTATQLGIADRNDPEASILGGARYLRGLLDRLPARIPDPDRSWLALAAYNVGMGHLEDARVLTEMQGADPDSWADVRARLPLLTEKRWYEKLKFGYARGFEPVHYVSRIRAFYDILVHLDENLKAGQQPAEASKLVAPAL